MSLLRVTRDQQRAAELDVTDIVVVSGPGVLGDDAVAVARSSRIVVRDRATETDVVAAPNPPAA